MTCKHNRIISGMVVNKDKKTPADKEHINIYFCAHCGVIMDVKEKPADGQTISDI